MLFSKNKFFLLACFLLLLYILPFIILGQDSYILIHDNLDANIVWFKILAESGMTFSGNYETISSFMGAPRVSLGNEFDLVFWLHNIFDPYSAYVINQVFIRIIAFWGMFLFLDKYILKETAFKDYVILISLLYCLLPFWPSGGLSVAGLPLITYVFLNIKYNVDTKKDWFIVIAFPFYSSFILSMMFYIVLAGVLWMVGIVYKKFSLKFTLGLFLFGLIYLLINYRLVEAFIFGTDFVSHRVERISEYYSFQQAIKLSLKHFITGQYHAHSLHIVFLPFISMMFLLNLVSKNKDRLFIGLFVLNIIISLWYGFWKYEALESIIASSSLLSSLNLSRVHFLTPFIWFVLFALSIKYYLTYFNYKYKMLLINLMVGLSIIFMLYKSDFIHEYQNSGISYNQFYSVNLFKNIDKFINKDKSTYKVISLGIHPSISQYNGFYTLDGYNANYRLAYKHKFRHIIAKELAKNKRLQKSFDNWGSRCYLFSNDIGYNFTRTKNDTYPIEIEIDSDMILRLGGKYIFSSYEIKNPKENKLNYLKVFRDKNSAWDIYLYEILESK